MSVRIADQEAFVNIEVSGMQNDRPRGDEAGAGVSQERGEGVGVAGRQHRLPVNEIVAGSVRGRGPPVAGSQVFEEFDTGPRRRSEPGDVKPGAEDVVQMLL